MTQDFRVTGILAVAIFSLIGCAAPIKEQPRQGYISDYSKLEKVADNAYWYTNPKVSEYSKFFIEQPTVLAMPVDKSGDPEFSEEEMQELITYFHDRLAKELTEDDGYEIVEKKGEGVATIRVALTALDPSNGALNVAFYTKITGAGLGGAAMEGEVVDSLSGEQLTAEIQWGSGSRVLRAGFTKLGDAKLQINKWSRQLRDRIDKAHEQAASS